MASRKAWIIFFDGYEEDTRIDGAVTWWDHDAAHAEAAQRQSAFEASKRVGWEGHYAVAEITVTDPPT